MTRDLMLYGGALVLALWGTAHIVIPTRDVVRGFGPISPDNRRVLLMEWIMEGLLLCFIGALVALVTAVVGRQAPGAVLVYRASAVMLVVMAGVSLATGARTAALPMKLCPPIFTAVAALFWLASTG